MCACFCVSISFLEKKGLAHSTSHVGEAERENNFERNKLRLQHLFLFKSRQRESTTCSSSRHGGKKFFWISDAWNGRFRKHNSLGLVGKVWDKNPFCFWLLTPQERSISASGFFSSVSQQWSELRKVPGKWKFRSARAKSLPLSCVRSASPKNNFPNKSPQNFPRRPTSSHGLCRDLFIVNFSPILSRKKVSGA